MPFGSTIPLRRCPSVPVPGVAASQIQTGGSRRRRRSSFSSKSVRVRLASRSRTPHSSNSTSFARTTEATATISARVRGCLSHSGTPENSVSTAVILCGKNGAEQGRSGAKTTQTGRPPRTASCLASSGEARKSTDTGPKENSPQAHRSHRPGRCVPVSRLSKGRLPQTKNTSHSATDRSAQMDLHFQLSLACHHPKTASSCSNS